jgi:bifunctional enzyme CysN/CysC
MGMKKIIAKITPAPTKSEPLKLAVIGHVDHGKSTLIGRLLADTGSLPEGKKEAIEAACARRAVPFEWAFLMDALQIERDQNVTVESSQIRLRGGSRDIVLIDAPGHAEFLQNMATAAAGADAALIVIDGEEGIGEQSQRHAALLPLLGVQHVIVAVNKMDRVGYAEKPFRAIEKEYGEYLRGLNVKAAAFIPISARGGDGLVSVSPRFPWYKGLPLLAAIEQLETRPSADHLPLRFPVQDVYKFDGRRIIAGRVESGRLKVGDTLIFSPGNAEAKVASIESGGREAACGESIGITLDQPLFVERGQIASHAQNPPQLTNLFRAQIFWLGRKPLRAEERYRLKLGTAEVWAELRSIAGGTLERGGIAEATWRTRNVVALDEFKASPATGRFVILEDNAIAGGGLISMEGFFDQRLAAGHGVKSKNLSEFRPSVTGQERAIANGHFGGILWFTGLSGSGKSTIAGQLQRRLFEKGCQAFVLDGDNIRKGLSCDLGFAPDERSENIRRVAEVAALFAQAGIIVITAFISPYREDRHRARAIAPDHFHAVHIKASLETCERRDAKGLYKQARQGKIAQFTGISAPYEAPENPDLIVDTEELDIEACVEKLMHYVEHQLVQPARELAKKEY